MLPVRGYQLRRRCHGCAGAVEQPVWRSMVQPRALEVAAVLVPFLQPTPGDVAARLLYLYIMYHLRLGFTRFVQYSQARALTSKS